jgi:hypothetical protein
VEVAPIQRPSADVTVGCGSEEKSRSPYPPPQATETNPLLKQFARLPQATSPLIKQIASRHLIVFVHVRRMVVSVSQYNKKAGPSGRETAYYVRVYILFMV